MQEVKYDIIAKERGKLRLYINDPAILKLIKTPLHFIYPIPIELEGEMVVGKTEDGKLHWFFTHDNPSFIPVFVDLESGKLKKLAVNRS